MTYEIDPFTASDGACDTSSFVYDAVITPTSPSITFTGTGLTHSWESDNVDDAGDDYTEYTITVSCSIAACTGTIAATVEYKLHMHNPCKKATVSYAVTFDTPREYVVN